MKRLALLFAACLVALTGATHAQSPPRTIGQPQRPVLLPSFIVMNAQGAQLANQKLVLTGVSPNAIVFADRPVRSAGHRSEEHTSELQSH